ncbi:MAG: hypothetical protein KAQ85_05685 [Thermodesulfovibrionia bacterium]|nr:hypothetical protein [Thermodesulfovibrionia bacterium]
MKRYIIGNHKEPTKKNIEDDEFKLCLGNIIHPDLFNLKPEDFTLEQFIEGAGSESWNLDENNDYGYMLMKHLLFRLVVPFEKWDNSGNPAPLRCDEYCEMLKDAYLKRFPD